MSKTNQGGLASRGKRQKQVIHYQNMDDPQRCLIRLYKLYMSKCPRNRPDNALYLKPLTKATGKFWYSNLGHNSLQKIVPNHFKAAGVDGYFTNYFLRSTNSTRLFEAHVDEQLIMERTGHLNTAVRSYIGDKLNSVTSDSLNRSISTTTNEVCREQGTKDTTTYECNRNQSDNVTFELCWSVEHNR